MNDQVATPETAPAENTNPEATVALEDASQKPSDNGTANAGEGLLASAGDETTPDFTPEPSQEADPSKAPSTVERPADIAEQFWDPVKGEVRAESLAKAYNDSRKHNNKLLQQLDGKGAAPENAEDYLKDYRPPARSRATGEQKEGDPLDRFGDLDAQDPVIVAMSKAAKNANLSKGQFDDFMQDVMEDIHTLLPEPFNAEKEMTALGENGKHLVDTNKAWIDRLASRGVLNETEYNLMLKFGATADGVLLTNKLRIDAGEKPIPVNASVETGRKTPDECAAMLANPLYHADGPEGDAFRAEVDKQFALTHGTDPA
jgi:hypothetical protein